jgi:hypothetical protein
MSRETNADYKVRISFVKQPNIDMLLSAREEYDIPSDAAFYSEGWDVVFSWTK